MMFEVKVIAFDPISTTHPSGNNVIPGRDELDFCFPICSSKSFITEEREINPTQHLHKKN